MSDSHNQSSGTPFKQPDQFTEVCWNWSVQQFRSFATLYANTGPAGFQHFSVLDGNSFHHCLANHAWRTWLTWHFSLFFWNFCTVRNKMTSTQPYAQSVRFEECPAGCTDAPPILVHHLWCQMKRDQYNMQPGKHMHIYVILFMIVSWYIHLLVIIDARHPPSNGIHPLIVLAVAQQPKQ